MELKPFCWYCGREFDSDQMLVYHQRARHFKCPKCPRYKTFYSISALRTHMLQMHQQGVQRVPHAMRSRADPEINPFISGMACVSLEDIHARRDAVQKKHPGRRIVVPPGMLQMAAAVMGDGDGLVPVMARTIPNPLFDGLTLDEVKEACKTE